MLQSMKALHLLIRAVIVCQEQVQKSCSSRNSAAAVVVPHLLSNINWIAVNATEHGGPIPACQSSSSMSRAGMQEGVARAAVAGAAWQPQWCPARNLLEKRPRTPRDNCHIPCDYRNSLGESLRM